MTPYPPFTEAHEAFRRRARTWIAAELRPHARAWEEACWFPDEAFRAVAAQGYFGLAFPTRYGGSDDVVAAAVLAEELQRCGSGGVAAGLGAHASIALPPIASFGTEDQKRRYLALGIAGERIGALAITEPDAGSDVAALRTHARRTDGGYVVNGAKAFITNGVRADFVVMAVRTRPKGGHRGISLLVVETDQAGYRTSKLDKLGWHASDTALISLEDVFVADENLLGVEHEGFKLIMANFQWERLVMALQAVGMMGNALERTLAFASDRSIAQDQAVRHRLADMATSLHACRCVAYDALARFAAGHDVTREVTMAKLLTQRAAFDLTDACLQIHGAAGYLREVEIERMVRDARLGPIGGGTDEVMREILGKSLLTVLPPAGAVHAGQAS